MKINKEEIMHIAKLANLKIKDDEVEEYVKNIQEILNFANTINTANVDGVETTIGATDNYNVFRKDEIKVFEDNKALLDNAPAKEDNMFKIPKVI